MTTVVCWRNAAQSLNFVTSRVIDQPRSHLPWRHQCHVDFCPTSHIIIVRVNWRMNNDVKIDKWRLLLLLLMPVMEFWAILLPGPFILASNRAWDVEEYVFFFLKLVPFPMCKSISSCLQMLALHTLNRLHYNIWFMVLVIPIWLASNSVKDGFRSILNHAFFGCSPYWNPFTD